MALAACGKKEEPARPPDLSPPGQVEAQAEVTASSGPVQLTLRLLKTRIATPQSPWYQFEIKNVGKNRIVFGHKVFHDEPWALKDSGSYRGSGIWLDVIGPDGRTPFERTVMNDIDTTGMLFLPHPDTEEGADIRKRMAGKTMLEQSMIVSEYGRAQTEKYRKEHPEPDLSFRLEPGASTATVAWALRDNPKHVIETRPQRQAHGRFGELFWLNFEQPGKYRVRAVYDYKSPYETAIKFNLPVKPEGDEVLVKTPFIDFEVVP